MATTATITKIGGETVTVSIEDFLYAVRHGSINRQDTIITFPGGIQYDLKSVVINPDNGLTAGLYFTDIDFDNIPKDLSGYILTDFEITFLNNL